MDQYAKNGITLILIAFNSIMNLDYAFCPTDEEIEQCETNMKVYCGNDLTLEDICAAKAILNTHGGRPLEQRYTPRYVHRYFKRYVSPFIPEVMKIVFLCRTEMLFEHTEIQENFINLCSSLRNVRAAIAVIRDRCTSRLAFMLNKTVQDVMMKTNIHEYFNSEGVLDCYVEQYLKLFSHLASLYNDGRPHESLSPEEYCKSDEINENDELD